MGNSPANLKTPLTLILTRALKAGPNPGACINVSQSTFESSRYYDRKPDLTLT